MPLKRIVLIIMCSILAVMVIMMGVMVGKVAPVLGALLGLDEDPAPTVPPTTQTDPTTEPTTQPTTQPTVPPTTQPTVPPTTEPKHEHDFSEIKEEKKPTCATAGHKIYICDCGETKLETIDPLAHSFGAGKLVAPTCTEGGYTLRKCAICGFEEKQDEQEALGHDYKETETVAVDCENDGYVESQCTRCEDIKRENVVKATGHAWVKGEVHDPTCTEEGYTEYTCSNEGCEEKKEDDKTDALGHKFGSWSIVEGKEPASGKPGEEERQCSVCEEKETRECVLDILEGKGINTSADNDCNRFIVNVGVKNSEGKEVTVYSYSITDYSRSLSSGSFDYDPESGLLITVKDKNEPYALEPGNGKLTLDKQGKPVANTPDPTDPSEPTGTADPSEPTGTKDPSEPAASEPTGATEGQ